MTNKTRISFFKDGDEKVETRALEDDFPEDVDPCVDSDVAVVHTAAIPCPSPPA